MRKRHRLAFGLVLGGSILILLYLIWLPRRDAVVTANHANRDSTQQVGMESAHHSIGESPYTRYAERRRTVRPRPQDTGESTPKYLVRAERKQQLERITGGVVLPIRGDDTRRPPYTLKEVLELYPFLKTNDGQVLIAEAERLRGLLNERMEAQKACADLSLSDAARSKALELYRQKVEAVGDEIARLTTLLVVRADRIIPSEVLTRMSPTFTNYMPDQMTRLLGVIAVAQERIEHYPEGRKRAHNLLRMAIVEESGFELSDEQADILLQTPLDRLAVGEFRDAR
jgi:hypothetical protein